MYYVLTKNRIYKGKSTNDINHQLDGMLDEDEFKQIGPDMIVNLSESDIDFVQDKKKLSSIMFGNFFKKDTTPKILAIVNLVFTFIILIRVMG